MTYIFFRENGFYFLQLKDDKEAKANAECNPGTIRVENAHTKDTVWRAKPSLVPM